ncbi:MAG TPA: hypothetical protein VM346_01125 [Sphingomicrobium sp.]|nr:hypothetical protein [Sphingomicrobium sp.]
MLLLVGDDLRDDVGSFRIGLPQRLQLMAEVGEDHAFDRFGGERDCASSDNACHKSEHETAEAAQMKAAAALNAAPIQFCSKQGAMLPLVHNDFIELGDEPRSAPLGNPALRSVNAHSAVLAGVINLEHHLSGGARSSQAAGGNNGFTQALVRAADCSSAILNKVSTSASGN